MTRPLFIAALELRRYLADRGELAFGVALPIALFALMYGTFSGGTSFNGTARIVDGDKGAVTAQILDRLAQVDGLSVELISDADATDRLDRSAILTAIVFPAGFSEAVATGKPARIITKQRGSGGDEGQIAANIVRAVTRQVASEFSAHSTVRQALAGDDVPADRIEATVSGLISESRERPFVTIETRIGGGGEDFVDRLMPGILVMFLTFAVTLGSQSIVEDRRLGTLERLLTTRLTLGQMFIGKFLAGMSRAVFQTLVLLSLGFAALRVAGAAEYFQVLAFCLLIAAAVSAIGLAIGALATNREQAVWSGVVITMFMTVFGGTFFPTGGGALDVLSHITLNHYAIDAIDAIISGGETLADQGPEAAVMAGIAIVGLAIARWGFRTSAQ